ncbi:(deoxy)nucleoside triphosphate pyrophosphohydrolase [Kocuria sp. HSID16901]|uniref:(deoxy)nucleoside triphosphate pyrophosphohydrolase n=1 Tax=Kocuria sp. HSID16901 TaxID=2419505 RepID=UPI00066078B1|nr:NUDIX domain-containing protein [Kocuria sp. HSID16901]RUQ21097.1 NUDIX domain-containing protein [Kocuria sp. HSID16901]
MAEKNYPIQVVGAALVDDVATPTRLLIARRSAPEALRGLWEFPGGKVEPGEDDVDGLLRELREELGVEATLTDEVPGPHVQGWPLNERLAMRVFVGTVVSGVPRPLEDHSELVWHRLDDIEGLLGLDWIPADYPIVEALIHRLA